MEKLFTPEFRNRLDALVPFHSLTKEMMLRIVDKFVAEIRETLADRKVELGISEKARGWLADNGFDFDPADLYARPLRRLIRTKLEDKLAHEILFGLLKKGGKARLDFQDGELVILPKACATLLSKTRKGPKREAESILAE